MVFFHFMLVFLSSALLGFYFTKHTNGKSSRAMLTLIENNAKQRAVSEEFDEEYKKLSDR